MSLQVPPQQVAFIKMLLALPEGQVDDLLQALAKARPHFNIFDLAGSGGTVQPTRCRSSLESFAYLQAFISPETVSKQLKNSLIVRFTSRLEMRLSFQKKMLRLNGVNCGNSLSPLYPLRDR